MAGDPGRTRPSILVFEPDAALRRLLDVGLTVEGFAVGIFASQDEAVDLVGKHQPDALVLSVSAQNDLLLLAAIKERYGLPALVTTDLSGEGDRVRALESGADDFMLKPFGIDELASRLRFLLGTPGERAGRILTLRFGANKIEIDGRRRLVKRNGKELTLSQSEWALLRHLADPPGEPRFDGELFAKVFGPLFTADSELLRLWITRLGQKLGDDPKRPSLIRRYHGAAYIFSPDEGAEETAAG